MNATHIIRGLLIVIPAILLADIGRRTIGGVTVQLIGIGIGIVIGVLVLYALGNFTSPKKKVEGGDSP